MSETAEAPVQVSTEQTQQSQETVTTTPNPFGNNSWSETVSVPKPLEVKTNTGTATTETVQTTTATPSEEEEEIIEPVEWLKREYGVDNPEILKQEREELKTLREKTAKGYEYKNDESKKVAEYINEGKIDDLYKFLDTQKRVDKLLAADLSDKNTAAELVKFGIQKDNPTLTSDEVDFLFNEKYAIPQKPTQAADELDEDYQVKIQSWQNQVANIEKRLIIEAKMNQPKLAQLKTEIVLPEISKPQVQSNEPTKEQVEALEKVRQNFLNKLESDYAKVEGFSTKVKDESVELPISYKIPDEAKNAIKGSLQEGFDLNEYMDKRWFDANGNPKIENIFYDRYVLENLDKILSGVANNAANQRLQHYIKSQKNQDLNSNTHQQTFQPNENGKSNVSPYSKDAWSERPPQLVNN